ncbi:MAG: hypothetical protein II341_07805, partial [Oscillospiraceae bacterium]|nr:hypothetical protein [Oscillospiraceae bacterium]
WFFNRLLGRQKPSHCISERAFRKTGNEQRRADFQMRLLARAPCILELNAKTYKFHVYPLCIYTHNTKKPLNPLTF